MLCYVGASEGQVLYSGKAVGGFPLSCIEINKFAIESQEPSG